MVADSGAPEGLAVRGSKLWVSLGQELGTPLGEVALEACRIADRLTELDAIIAGKGVLNLLMVRLRTDIVELFDESTEPQITITISGVLSEARQQAAQLANLLALLGMKAGAQKSRGPVVKTGLDQLAERRGAKTK